MVGCNFPYEIWARIATYFASKTWAKVRWLKTQLKSIKKQGSDFEYLHKINRLVDYLAVVSSPITIGEHIEVILDGLNEDYATFITTMMSRVKFFSINEIEALLIDQEEMIERFRKSKVPLVEANMT